MPVSVVWKLSAPRHGGLHAFEEGKIVAVCSRHLTRDGDPLALPKGVDLRCRRCMGRLKMAEEFGVDTLPKSFAGLVMKRNLDRERKTWWRVLRHGGQRHNEWRMIYDGPLPGARHKFNEIRGRISVAIVGFRRRGGVRLVNPDGKVEHEFIRSPWLKEREHGAEVHEV